MEEAPEEFPDLEPVEEVAELPPEPPVLKRANKLTEKITCEGCGKSLSLHAYKYSHKCKARAPDEPVEEKKPKRVDSVKLAEALKDAKPPMTDKQSIKPVKQRAVINRVPEYVPPEPPYEPSHQEIYSHLLQQRQQQAYMRHQAMLAPYQQMFAMRAQ